MNGVTTFAVGALKVHAIETGIQRLDGGAMFGVVPKPLWQRRIPADDRNRIRLTMRVMLIEHPDGLVLVDTGLGNKEPEKFLDIYGIENRGSGGRTLLEERIGALGFAIDDVQTVIDSHLHFDHAGGNTWIAPDDASQRVQLTFPRAQYVMHRGEYEWAMHTNERTQASYFERNFAPVVAAGRARLVEGESVEVVRGVRMIVTPGHTPWHCAILLEDGGDRLMFPADAIPTAHHLPLPWIMGYDVEPLRTLETKRSLYAMAVRESWQVVFEHDADTAGGRLKEGPRGLEVELAAAG